MVLADDAELYLSVDEAAAWVEETLAALEAELVGLASVKRRVRDALSRRRFASGELGFFHPDNWTFGQPLFLSQLYRAVMRVDGISWVDVNHFHRFGRAPNRELEDGVVRAAPREVLRLDNDPNFQERGRLVVEMRGGR